MQFGYLSSEGPRPTDAKATWLPQERITVAGQRRNLTGLRSAAAPGRTGACTDDSRREYPFVRFLREAPSARQVPRTGTLPS